jgi:hypothetical protein
MANGTRGNRRPAGSRARTGTTTRRLHRLRHRMTRHGWISQRGMRPSRPSSTTLSPTTPSRPAPTRPRTPLRQAREELSARTARGRAGPASPPLSAAIIGLGAIGVMAGDPDESDGEQVAAEDDSTTTTERPTTTERATTTSAPPTPPPTARPPATTAAPTTSPPATQPRPGGNVTPGAFCSPAGATGTSADGVPMTCSTEKCHGTPHEQPRWRRTNC